MNLSIPLVANSLIQPATRWPGGQGMLSAAATLWNGNVATLNALLADGVTNFATAITASANGLSAVFTLPQTLIVVTGLVAPLTLAGVVIAGTAGQFTCTANTLAVGNSVTISGVYGGTGSITGYVNPTTYTISATNGTTSFTLQQNGQPIVTTAGTPTGLTYTVGNININALVIPTNLN